ncbi:hypothetical protein GF351_02025 [Candidatus Woesearchaeota archaeon]|nr:hypothetical protein [Candidatus Woesearchaeota archaeon]
MYNLQSMRGRAKGTIAECMFRLVNKNLVLTRLLDRKLFFRFYGSCLTHQQMMFLDKNWLSIDGIEIKRCRAQQEIILYEIKSKNRKYASNNRWPTKVTVNSCRIYKVAKHIGFQTKLATVMFGEDWNYSINIENFDDAYWTIDKPGKFGRF